MTTDQAPREEKEEEEKEEKKDDNDDDGAGSAMSAPVDDGDIAEQVKSYTAQMDRMLAMAKQKRPVLEVDSPAYSKLVETLKGQNEALDKALDNPKRPKNNNNNNNNKGANKSTEKPVKKNLAPWFNPTATGVDSNYVFIPTPNIPDEEAVHYRKRGVLTKLICQNVHGNIRHEDVSDILRNFEQLRVNVVQTKKHVPGARPRQIDALAYRDGGLLISTHLLNNCEDDTLLSIVSDVLTGMKVMPSTFLFDVRMDSNNPYIFSQIKIRGGGQYSPSEAIPKDMEQVMRNVPNEFRVPCTDINASISINTNAFPSEFIAQVMSTAAPDQNIQADKIFSDQYVTEINYPYEIFVYLKHIKSLSLTPAIVQRRNIFPEHIIRQKLVEIANDRYYEKLEQLAENAVPDAGQMLHESLAPVEEQEEEEDRVEEYLRDGVLERVRYQKPDSVLDSQLRDCVPTIDSDASKCIKPVTYDKIVNVVNMINREFDRLAEQQRLDKKKETQRHKEEMEQRRWGKYVEPVPKTIAEHSLHKTRINTKQLSSEVEKLVGELDWNF